MKRITTGHDRPAKAAAISGLSIRDSDFVRIQPMAEIHIVAGIATHYTRFSGRWTKCTQNISGQRRFNCCDHMY